MEARPGQPAAEVLASLGDNLIIRRAGRKDAAAIAALVYKAHADQGGADDSVSTWVLDLMERPHPTMTAENVLVVENLNTHELVSTLNLIPQTWTYGGVPFGVSRVELVATQTEYQGRGLVRRLFEALHRWSVERGDLLQAITGIPNFYLQFGYEYALATGGGRTGSRRDIPPLPPGAREPFQIRVAAETDLPALARLDAAVCARSLVSCARDEAAWRYELNGRGSSSMLHSTVLVLETNGDENGDPTVAGFAVVGSGGFPGGSPSATAGRVNRFETANGVSWYAATHSLLRYIAGPLPKASANPVQHPPEEVSFLLGEQHPAYEVASRVLAQQVPAWSWYIRLPDLPGFLRHIAPLLEARLESSTMAGYSGELVVSFYRTALRLLFDGGRVTAQSWSDANFRTAGACFPGLTFLQLVMGYRSLEELEFASPDCHVPPHGEARLLLKALFPRADSSVWPIG
jgi:predicted N-acetyltransferase YhbS